MKKVIFIFAIICSTFQSMGQKVFQTKIGYSSLDDKGIVSNTILATPSITAIFDIQSDGPKTLSLSAGPNIAKKHDETKVYFMPGIMYDWGRNKLNYSATLLFSREDKKGTEAEFIIKGIRRGKGDDQYLKLKAGGDILFGKLLKFGPFIEGELQRERDIFIHKPLPDVDVIFIEKLVSFGLKIKWHPKIVKNFFVSCFTGMEVKSKSGKYLYSSGGLRRETENKFAFGLNLGYKF